MKRARLVGLFVLLTHDVWAAPPAHEGAAGSDPRDDPPKIPEDTVTEDPSLPAGTLVATVVDGDNRPLVGLDATLGIVIQSIAKGDLREERTAKTSERGEVSFDGLLTETRASYRVKVVRGGGKFSSSPFRLPPGHGMRVRQHVYEVTDDPKRALVFAQGIFYTEMKDDRVSVEQIFEIHNASRVAWVPQAEMWKLPKEHTGFSTEDGMTDIRVSDVAGEGVKLTGTFPPGRHSVSYRWQLPWNGTSSAEMEVGLPPHTATLQVMSPWAGAIRLRADGLPEAATLRNQRGQKVQVTQYEWDGRGAPLSRLRVRLEEIPTPGPGRWLVSTLSVLLLVAVSAWQPPRKKHQEGATEEELLAELAALDEAKQAGVLGPESHEKLRRELIDRLAVVMKLARERAGDISGKMSKENLRKKS